MKISIIVGTRPEIIKMASIIKTAIKENIDYDIIHTEQHYNYELNKIFFEELELPIPEYRLNVGSGTQAQQTANAMIKIEKVLNKNEPDLILVEGDTIELGHLPLELQNLAHTKIFTRKNAISLEDPSSHKIIPFEEIEKQVLVHALKASAGNISEATRGLKIGRATFYRKLKKYNLLVDKNSTSNN